MRWDVIYYIVSVVGIIKVVVISSVGYLVWFRLFIFYSDSWCSWVLLFSQDRMLISVLYSVLMVIFISSRCDSEFFFV